MRIKVSLAAVIGAIAMATCAPAFAGKVYAVTPSGSADMLFGENADQVVSKISSKCMDLKWQITSSSSNSTCN